MRLILCTCCEKTPKYQMSIGALERFFDVVEIIGNIKLDCCNPAPILAEFTVEESVDQDNLNYDYILVLGDANTNRSTVIRFLVEEMGAERKRILPDKVVCLEGFSIDRYMNLLDSNISIISNNCFAGMVYHLFGMPFLSPTINMFQNNDSFLRFVSDLYGHLSKPIVFDRMEKGEYGEYPIFHLGDAVLHMNHYDDPGKAESIWYRRLARLNPKNLLIMMYTDDPEEVAVFHYLPFSKKVCFVPFPCELPDVYPIPPDIDSKAAFWQLVLAISDGSLECYDLFDMLLEGKKNQIMDF